MMFYPEGIRNTEATATTESAGNYFIFIIIFTKFCHFIIQEHSLNIYTYVIEPEFYFESEGSDTCSQGEAIMDIKTCREACKTLNVQESGIFGGNVCYKDIQGRCNQNGKNGPVASLICKRAGTFSFLVD